MWEVTISKINPSLEFKCPSFLQSCLNNRDSIVCVASAGIALLGGLFLYRYLNSSNPFTTNLSNYIVLTPSKFKVGTLYRPTEEQMQKLYDDAKKMICSLPKDFHSRVDFNDRYLEIGFKYDVMAMKGLINHDKLWFIFTEEEKFKPFSGDNVFEGAGTRFCIKDFGKAYMQLLRDKDDFTKKAEHFFENEAVIKTIPDFEGEHFSNCTDLVNAIFKQSKGLSFADAHSQIQSKHFLISQMPLFVKNNVEVLFMEGIFECQQADLDAYFDPQVDVKAMPLSIRYNFSGLDKILETAGGYTMLDVITHAKLAGIKRVVAIDTQLVTLGDEDHKTRVSGMNYFAKPVIEREMPKGNYVIFSGASHAASDWKTNIPSFSQLFGIPSIYVYGSRIFMISNNQNREIRMPLVGEPNATLRCNFSVGIPPEACKKAIAHPAQISSL